MANIRFKDFAEKYGITEQKLCDILEIARIIRPDNMISGVKYAFCERFYREDCVFESIVNCYNDITKEGWWEVTPLGQNVLLNILNIYYGKEMKPIKLTNEAVN